jgi:hypothetical protein
MRAQHLRHGLDEVAMSFIGSQAGQGKDHDGLLGQAKLGPQRRSSQGDIRFCKAFLPHWNKQLLSARRPRGRRLSFSEIMTILIHFHQSNYRNFKAYYLEYVMTHLRNRSGQLQPIR